MSELEDTDVDGARKQELAMSVGRPWFLPSTVTLLTFTIMIGGGWMLMQPTANDLKYALVAIMTSVAQYYYGTTKGSSEQRAIIATALSTAQTTKPPEGG